MGCVGSTEPGWDPAKAYELHPDVALRMEPFGALAYHYGNRRLTFLRSLELVELVESLSSHDSAEASMQELEIGSDRLPAMSHALESLYSSGLLRQRDVTSAA
ncbi:MAG: mycofactocin biosynthesis chaperone MftB [Acidimicrobiales bacterium]